MAAVRRGSRIYAGVDEAGYGPPLGPLCVGLAVFRLEDPRGDPEEAPPDLWRRLRGVVCRHPQRALRSTIPVNDSKALKLPNSSRTRRPLEHLELGVLSFLAASGMAPASDRAFFECLGVALEEAEWYGVEGPTPAAVDFGGLRLRMHGRRLGERLRGRGIEMAGLQCRAVCEERFNEGIRRTGSKAAVSFRVVTDLLREVFARHGEEAPFVAIDRQGGRRRYASALGEAFPEAHVKTLFERAQSSRYALRSGDRSLVAHFEVEADGRHMPTALASMTAKLVRETAMARFNDYWARACPELGWTAGYGAAARRWLADLEARMGSGARQRLQRLQ